ncbi:sodium:solute symporter family protein [Pelagicoccus mobilis]|uniref:Na+/proline symporter n=1 Tax=Pelagicoccus mobilis TaxID=415221 RepID=A0A934VJY6_9BACT|nr:hypothetical protein [Pelagicoccus mobilis]MBK1876111.1 hypothetical protein [Pelagicoccus mobilis]
MDHSLEYLTIGIYLTFLLGIGFVFARFNRNLSDYVRGGGQGTWWMVGMSIMMASVSTNTFVGNAGAAFQAGYTPVVVYLGSVVGGVICGLFLAAWCRQTRALTVADLYRERFGPEVEHFSVIVGIFLYPISGGVMLLGLAIFCSSVFGVPVMPTIVVIGIVVMTYSTFGGRWAVMATDFFQGLILIPISILVAWLSWKAVGGWEGFTSYFSAPDIAADFKFVKDPGQFSGDRFGWRWIVAVFLSMTMSVVSLSYAGRYLSVKDGREAKKAAWFTVFAGLFNIVVFFIPPIVARFLYADEVAGMALKTPSESAYAVIAMKLLPNGLLGILMVAMFAATMSSMDSGLNGMTGTIVRNFFPALWRRCGWPELGERGTMLACKLVTVCLGCIIIGVALALSLYPGLELFDVFLIVSSIIGLPIGMPLFFGMFVKKLPRWSFFFIMGCSLLPPIWSQIAGAFFDSPWSYHDRILGVIVAGSIGAVISRLMYSWSSDDYKNRIEAFFVKMKTPIDYQQEVGENRDYSQYRMMGNVSVVGGGFILLLLLVPNETSGRLNVLFVSGFVMAVGCLLLWLAKGKRGKS